ncbi:MAG: GDP-mannose mannosyl hydrolase [Limisphaerales bacterium]
MKRPLHTRGKAKSAAKKFLSAEEFETVVRLTPLVSIDLIVRSEEGTVLVGRRSNEPAKDFFFVPGGRIFKGETVKTAFRRITLTELGVEREEAQARFLGVFDHHYAENFFEKPGFGTQYVVLAYELKMPKASVMLTPDQHNECAWKTEAEILSLPEAHENTKAYFRQKL